MTAPHAFEIINGYLARLEAETADIPRAQRHELVDSVREHIVEARATLTDETDAGILNMLDRLGDPTVLADEERERLGIRREPAPRAGLLEIGALVLTPLVWPVGVILLWASNAWNTRDKLIGTFILPGGLPVALMIVAFAEAATRVSSGTTTLSASPPAWLAPVAVVVTLLLILAPIFTGIYLAIRLRQRTRAAASLPAAYLPEPS